MPLRSLDEIFFNLSLEQKREVFSQEGLVRTLGRNDVLGPLPTPRSRIVLHQEILRANPSHRALSLLVVPYTGRTLTKLDAYNSLGRVRDLNNRYYFSHVRGREIILFDNVTRLRDSQSNSPIPDPPPAREIPPSETVYIRLREANFGNTYFRGDLSTSDEGITYTLKNYRNITFLFITVVRREQFTAHLYLEPLTEGMLIYSIAGVEMSDFLASMVDVPSFIATRVRIFTQWIRDNLHALSN